MKIWGNDEYRNEEWRNRKHMEDYWREGILCGVADLMRWEILHKYGGVTIDADSICLQELDDWFFECDFFAAYENEVVRPGLVSNGLVGASMNNPVIEKIIDKTFGQRNILRRFVWHKLKFKKRAAWRTVGPMALTSALQETKYLNATLLPSHFFYPRHHSGASYTGNGPVYCTQLWSSTEKVDYGDFSRQEIVDLINKEDCK